MKRLLPLAIVALLVLAPAGAVLAAKAALTKKAATTQVTHHSSKQKARNQKLVQELLTIIDETDNKMTFAACVECLTQLKPPREVVVPAIIRKADKMGWLRNDNEADNALLGDCLIQFLPNRQPRPAYEPNSPYMMPYPYPVPPPPPPFYSAPPCPMPPPVPCVSTPCLTAPCRSYPMAERVTPPPPAPACPYSSACPDPCPCPPCAIAQSPFASPAPSCHAVPPACSNVQIVSVTPAPVQDKLTMELLKILDETDSKVTFALVVETLSERCDNWDAVIPTLIRKADKMGWLHISDKDFDDKFTDNLAELIATKVKKAEKSSATPATSCPCPNGTTCPAVSRERMQDLLNQSECSGPIGHDLRICSPDAEELPMPRCATETLPMPHAEELLPMPHAAEMPPVFDFFYGPLQY